MLDVVVCQAASLISTSVFHVVHQSAGSPPHLAPLTSIVTPHSVIVEFKEQP